MQKKWRQHFDCIALATRLAFLRRWVKLIQKGQWPLPRGRPGCPGRCITVSAFKYIRTGSCIKQPNPNKEATLEPVNLGDVYLEGKSSFPFMYIGSKLPENLCSSPWKRDCGHEIIIISRYPVITLQLMQSIGLFWLPIMTIKHGKLGLNLTQ